MERPPTSCVVPAARSGRACQFLGDQGHDVVNVAGGMIAWTAAGFDTATGAGSGATGG